MRLQDNFEILKVIKQQRGLVKRQPPGHSIFPFYRDKFPIPTLHRGGHEQSLKRSKSKIIAGTVGGKSSVKSSISQSVRRIKSCE